MQTDALWGALGGSVPDILMLLDSEGTILFINRPLRGKRADELVGTAVFDLLPVAARARVWVALRDVFKRSETSTLELTVTRSNGQVRWFQASAGPFRDGGRIIGATVLARDITSTKATEFALRQLERQLEQLQRLDLLGQLVTGIVHDFGNLLVIIRASIDAVMPALTEGSAESDAALAIWTAAERGRELIRQIMAFVRSGVQVREPVDVNVVIEDVFLMLNRVLGGDITLQKRLAPGTVQVLAERGQLDQILANLVVNARDALPSGGTITMATRMDAARNEVVLSVTDTGSGMDDITQRRIFEPFFTTKARGHGTGLGLSTVAMIAELLGGRVVVKSTIGVGTTIDVILPGALSGT